MKHKHGAARRRKRWFILLIILLLVSAVALYLHYPLLQKAGSSNGYNCSRDHIYIPRRLDFLGCKTIAGTVKWAKIEPDGDSHLLLDVDPPYKSLLTEQNYRKQQGYMVIEDTCHHSPRDILIVLICRGYRSSLPEPTVGQRYEITGNYVIDDWHGSWAEIHGLAELKLIK